MKIFTLIIGSILLLETNGKPSNSLDTGISQQTVSYLAYLGYYKIPRSEIGVLANEKTIQKSLEDLQRFGGITVTGKLDAETQELIETPRCGLPDVSGSMETRKRRYTLQGTRWKKTGLTWKLLNDNNDGLSRTQVEETLTQAFNKWNEITNIHFTKLELKSTEKVDIEVKFVQNYHQDPYPFDGQGGTLAHAFYPHTNEGLSGDVHFDDAEVFTLGSKQGRNLLWVAVHEIGHSIGLEHSNVRAAIMFPWYKGYMGTDFPLNYDDIVGAQSIYGGKALSTPKTEITPKSVVTIPPEKCTNRMKTVLFDKVTKITYVINDDKVYILDQHLALSEGPLELSKLFPQVSSVDSGYTKDNGETILFSGTRYYIYTNLEGRKFVKDGSIFDKFTGLSTKLTKIDAAFVWSGNGRTYLFSGEEYYRYNEYYNKIDHNYPRNIVKNWGGVQANIDSVFIWKTGVTYFFKGNEYYRMSSKPEVEPNYPKQIAGIWFKCKSSLTEASGRSSGHAFNSSFFTLFISTFAVIVAKMF